MSEPLFEPVTRPLAGWRQFCADVGPLYAANGLIGFVFAATGPVAVVLSVGVAGGLSEPQLASWVFGAFFLNGLLSIAFCLLYQRPLVFFWTIPGTVLVGPALTHLSFAEVTGAFISSSGERSRHNAAGVVVGLLALAFGLLSPLFTRLMLSTPPAFIVTLAGLAMLRVLQAAFVTAFKARFSLGAVVAFIVTVAGVPIASIGSPFWGLVFGFTISALLERDDFRAPA